MLNCLGEGEYSALMKHFLKRFPAGADRFAGVGTFTAANGASHMFSMDCCRAQTQLAYNHGAYTAAGAWRQIKV